MTDEALRREMHDLQRKHKKNKVQNVNVRNLALHLKCKIISYFISHDREIFSFLFTLYTSSLFLCLRSDNSSSFIDILSSI